MFIFRESFLTKLYTYTSDNTKQLTLINIILHKTDLNRASMHAMLMRIYSGQLTCESVPRNVHSEIISGFAPKLLGFSGMTTGTLSVR